MSSVLVKHDVSFLQAIKARAHWHAVLEPSTFEERRIPSLDECWRLIESCRVVLTDRDYPHIHDGRENGEDWIASWGRFRYGGQDEYWRLFQSGQFVHRASLHEDAVVTMGLGPHRPYVEYLEVLHTVTEVFEFAARLGYRGAFGDSVSITIELQGVEGRMLETSAHPQFLVFEPHGPAKGPILQKCWKGTVAKLLGNSAGLALDVVVAFFAEFDHPRPLMPLLADRQQRFLKRM